MAINHVGNLLGGNTSTPGDTLTITGSQSVTAGNDILVFVACDKNIGVDSIADNLGNAYQLVYASAEEVNTPSLAIRIFRSSDIIGGTLTSQVITFGDPTFSRCAMSTQYSGLVNGVSVGGETNYSNGSTAPEGHSISGDGLHLFAVASMGDEGAFTPPTGYTDIMVEDQGTGATQRAIRFAHLIGVDDTGLKIGAFANSVAWVTATADVTAPFVRPALAGVSFDGVTIR